MGGMALVKKPKPPTHADEDETATIHGHGFDSRRVHGGLMITGHFDRNLTDYQKLEGSKTKFIVVPQRTKLGQYILKMKEIFHD